MTSRSELDRKAVKESGSPLGGHSLNQRIMRDQRAGAVRIFGKEAENAVATNRRRREDSKRERRQALYDSINNIFQGKPTEKDVLNFLIYSEEFEEAADSEVPPNATIIDFKGCESSDARFGEPEFFRIDKK